MTTAHQSGRTGFSKSTGLRQAFPSFPSSTPFLPPFCSRPIYRASRMRKTNTHDPNFDHFLRERLLRGLVVGSLLYSERFFSGYSGFLLSSKTNISKFQFDLDYCQALYHEPLARVIAQALPVFDIVWRSWNKWRCFGLCSRFSRGTENRGFIWIQNFFSQNYFK